MYEILYDRHRYEFYMWLKSDARELPIIRANHFFIFED